MNNSEVVKLEHVSKIFKDADSILTIIKELTFSFKPGKSTAIIGRSGVGKSTLLHLLAGIDLPSEGTVFLGDVELNNLTPEKRASYRGKNIGFIFQFHHLFSEFTAIENVSMPLIIAGVKRTVAYEQSSDLLCRMGLKSRLKHYPSKLSGGEQQRVAVARAIVAKPKLLLADEPTGSLDPSTAEQIRELLLEIQRETKSTMIVVTHSQELASHMDCIVEMGRNGLLGDKEPVQ
jgi:lipoprotein-releasing system ATP-binding protein